MQLFEKVCHIENKSYEDINSMYFHIYKDDQRSMELKNIEIRPKNFETPNLIHESRIPTTFMLKQMLEGLNEFAFSTDQRAAQNFACISIFNRATNKKPFSVQLVDIYTYQCFPTAQSAVRYARKIIRVVTPINKCRLFVIPLMIWIGIFELEKYDVRNKGIEDTLLRKHNLRYKSKGYVKV